MKESRRESTYMNAQGTRREKKDEMSKTKKRENREIRRKKTDA